MVDLKNCLFTFLDPLVTSELINGAKYKEAFEKWTLDYNNVKVVKSESLPTHYNRSQSFTIFTGWKHPREGALIATEVMDTLEPLQKICHKCGLLLSTSNYTVKMCQGNCRPHKVFHLNCIGEKYHKMIKFCCQVCNHRNREEGCYSCGGEISDLAVECCINSEITGCSRFVHTVCLPGGMTNYNCGLCTLNIK